MNLSHTFMPYLFTILTNLSDPEFKTDFSANDTSYLYTVEISSTESCKTISRYLFDKKALFYFSDFADSIHITDLDSNSYMAEMKFSKFFYKGSARYVRVLHQVDSMTVDLIRFNHNWSAIPQLKYAKIRYYFTPLVEGCLIRYEQHVILNRNAGWIYRKMAQYQLDQFAIKLHTYIRMKENPNGQ